QPGGILGLGGVDGGTGWMRVGGTSAGTPMIAAIYALAGNGAGVYDASTAYTHRNQLNDVTAGTNDPYDPGLLGLGLLLTHANCGSYLCNAGPGYDGPTGLGTPSATGAF